MRASLLLLGFGVLSPLASAQTTPDSVRTPEAPVTRASGDSTTAQKRVARLAFPTEGGVFYYRAGSGSGIRRRTPTGAPESVQPGSAPTAVQAAPLATVPGVSPRAVATPEAGRQTERAASSNALASGVTQRDLDRLENRLMNTLERRLEEMERARLAEQRATPVQPDRTQPGAERTVVVPVPVPVQERQPEATRNTTPEVSPTQTPVTPEAAPPIVTVEEIERDILDTGLFRTTFVNFEFAKAALLPISEQTLDALVTVLSRYPALRIEIGGHTDNVGSDATNDALSQRRAESVADYLASQGISRQRLTSVGYGENRPVASNESETGRALNRRVEFRVLNPEDAQRIRD